MVSVWTLGAIVSAPPASAFVAEPFFEHSRERFAPE
jgi:hypothetical protein